MKKYILFLFGLFLIQVSFAQTKENSGYNEAMLGLLNKLNKAEKPEALTAVKNGFLRVAAIDSTQWLPFYYAAYAGILETYRLQGDAVDKVLDEVDRYLEKATRLTKNLDEVLVLQSWAASARIMVNPMTRGAKYGMQSSNFLSRAQGINPSNPRIYFLKGQNAFYTPEQFGGGKKIALENLTLAQQLYGKFKLENDLMPNWGKEETDKRLKEMDKIGAQSTPDEQK